MKDKKTGQVLMNDLHGLYPTGKFIPYIAIPLTAEDEKQLVARDKLNTWYQVDGKRVFEVKDEQGKPTGQFMAFLLLSHNFK